MILQYLDIGGLSDLFFTDYVKDEKDLYLLEIHRLNIGAVRVFLEKGPSTVMLTCHVVINTKSKIFASLKIQLFAGKNFNDWEIKCDGDEYEGWKKDVATEIEFLINKVIEKGY